MEVSGIEIFAYKNTILKQKCSDINLYAPNCNKPFHYRKKSTLSDFVKFIPQMYTGIERGKTMVSKLFLTVHILKILILLFCYCIVLKGLILGILGVLEFLDTFNHKKNILKRKKKLSVCLIFFTFLKKFTFVL